jgi:hypothetical protein
MLSVNPRIGDGSKMVDIGIPASRSLLSCGNIFYDRENIGRNMSGLVVSLFKKAFDIN